MTYIKVPLDDNADDVNSAFANCSCLNQLWGLYNDDDINTGPPLHTAIHFIVDDAIDTDVKVPIIGVVVILAVVQLVPLLVLTIRVPLLA